MTRLSPTPENLARVCVAIWGLQWQYRLAAELGRNPRSVARWADGDRGIPPTIWPWLRSRLLAHSSEAIALARQLPTK